MNRVIITKENFLCYFPLFDTRMIVYNDELSLKLMHYSQYLEDGLQYLGVSDEREREQFLKDLNDLIAENPLFIRSGGEGRINMNTDEYKILKLYSVLGKDIEVGDLLPTGRICAKTRKYVYYSVDKIKINRSNIEVTSSFLRTPKVLRANSYQLVANISVLDERISEDIRQDTFLIRQEKVVGFIKSQAEGYSQRYDANVYFFEEYAVDDFSFNKCLQFIKLFGNSTIFDKLTESLNEAYQRNLRKLMEKNISNQISSSELKNEVQQKQDDRKPKL